jgi:hypothetical protein
MNKRKRKSNLSAIDALDLAESMSGGEAAQLAIAAELMGLQYDDFITELVSNFDEDVEDVS